MTETVSQSKQTKFARRMPSLVTGITLLVLGSAIVSITQYLRDVVRRQIIQQDGIALYAASLIPTKINEELPAEERNDPTFIFFDLAGQVLNVSKARSDLVMGVRVFNELGELEFKINATERTLSATELDLLKQFKTTSTLESDASLGEELEKGTDKRAPLILALVPLSWSRGEDTSGEIANNDEFIGAAEFILDGSKVVAVLRGVDQDLWFYAALIFLFSGGVTSVAILGAFRRLQTANKLLEQRTESLLRANHELTMSAKTSAIGAITAHLIHDLKSPLFGLQSFVSARGSADDEDWDVALDTTHRMQKVIAEIVRILQEEKTTEKYELTIEEIFTLLRSKLEPQCEKAGLRFRMEGGVNGSLINRDANIVLLTITNIVQNAIQATPRGGEISVKVGLVDGCICFEMRDTGPGLPPHILCTLFTPSRSTKSGGTGLGLAISKQLANHIGAELVLKETSTSGTVFELRVPERVLLSELVVP